MLYTVQWANELNLMQRNKKEIYKNNLQVSRHNVEVKMEKTRGDSGMVLI